jgi:hypothetical protein
MSALVLSRIQLQVTGSIENEVVMMPRAAIEVELFLTQDVHLASL